MNIHELTKYEIQQLQKMKLEELVGFAGGNKHLAFMLRQPLGTIASWVARGRISKEGAKLVEEHEKLGRKFKAVELRPDLMITI